MHYVYVLKDLLGAVTWVGCTKNPWLRHRNHRQDRKCMDEMDIVCIVETKDEGHRIEQAYIEVLRRRGEPLENIVVNGTERSKAGWITRRQRAEGS